jgi:hypothetical protein
VAKLGKTPNIGRPGSWHDNAGSGQERKYGPDGLLLGETASITSLRLADNESDADTCVRGLYEIDEHHGAFSSAQPYDRVHVLGCAADVLEPSVMQDLELGDVHSAFDGFTVDKLVPKVDRSVQSPT